jgi:DNA-binding NarL/FixJ family response regulator
MPRSLTDRELSVVRLLALGRSRADIASGVRVAKGTVDSHVQSPYCKTGTRTHAQLTLWLQGGTR